jgi:hypothetical protein
VLDLAHGRARIVRAGTLVPSELAQILREDPLLDSPPSR